MSCDWKSVIPEDLHANFWRVIEELRDAEFMRLLVVNEAHTVANETEIDAQLEMQFTQQYVERYQAGGWPPITHLGMRLPEVKHQKWICPNCEGRNFSTVTACSKCGDAKPEFVNTISMAPRAFPIQQQSNPQSGLHDASLASLIPSARTWTCRECGCDTNNCNGSKECGECGESRDRNKINKWPSSQLVKDVEVRRKMRLEVFRRIMGIFQVEDPFAATHIPQSSFVKIAHYVQAMVLADMASEQEQTPVE